MIITTTIDPCRSFPMKYCKVISQYKRCNCGGEFEPFIDMTNFTSKTDDYEKEKDLDESNLTSVSYFNGTHHNIFVRKRVCWGGRVIKKKSKKIRPTVSLFCPKCGSYRQIKFL